MKGFWSPEVFLTQFFFEKIGSVRNETKALFSQRGLEFVSKSFFLQGIFTVDPKGIRRVVGLFDYGSWDASACGKDDEYIGEFFFNPSSLPLKSTPFLKNARAWRWSNTTE